MTEYTIDMIKGTTVMEQMRSLIKVVIEFINGEGGDVEELRQMILTEIADRTAQDGQLQLQIQAEATARISQDNELRTQIQTETGQREAQVQSLTADLEQEAQTRQASDDALETAIQTAVQGEADARQAQDATLQQALQNEVTARQSQDSQLSSDIQSEADARQAQDATLLQGLQNEAGARQSQDAQLSTDIQNEASQRASADSGLSHDITDLTTRVGTVETSVADIISGSQAVGAAQNQGHADTQGEAQVGDHIVSTTANIGTNTKPVKIVNGVPVEVVNNLALSNNVLKKMYSNSLNISSITDLFNILSAQPQEIIQFNLWFKDQSNNVYSLSNIVGMYFGDGNSGQIVVLSGRITKGSSSYYSINNISIRNTGDVTVSYVSTFPGTLTTVTGSTFVNGSIFSLRD